MAEGDPWATLDAYMREQHRLFGWLKAAHSDWLPQPASADGCWVVMRRQSKSRPRTYCKAKTVDRIQELVLQAEEAETWREWWGP